MIEHIIGSIIITFLIWFILMLIAMLSNGSLSYYENNNSTMYITLFAFLVLIIGLLWTILSVISALTHLFYVPFIDQIVFGVK
jgi:hypothetical protein